MPVRVGYRQFVMDVLGNGKRRETEDDADHPEDEAGLQER